ncbi:hypothetical protein [Actomonas aquatica]|uniref:Uncharacterized protein n=1 Tax=Actomonas aquatica TaxID=2866162 RepID=A0ABZ1C642_9BACT|nr:hypothetical protein [Opitutus sp. WL0086]WRQ87191.1 hypothetical protein K1X11_020455 [Opitutus sp. WL0086]
MKSALLKLKTSSPWVKASAAGTGVVATVTFLANLTNVVDFIERRFRDEPPPAAQAATSSSSPPPVAVTPPATLSAPRSTELHLSSGEAWSPENGEFSFSVTLSVVADSKIAAATLIPADGSPPIRKTVITAGPLLSWKSSAFTYLINLNAFDPATGQATVVVLQKPNPPPQ